MIQEHPQPLPSILSNSETKLFRLKSSGNWYDQGTGITSITRALEPTETLEITFKLHQKSPVVPQNNNQSIESQENSTHSEEYMFESIGSYSIQSNSILVFTCREKRFALSFKDSDAKFLEFFNHSIKSSEEQLVPELSSSSIMDYMTKDDGFISTLKVSFSKAETQQDLNSILNLVDVFKRLLNDCNQSFIRMMFTDDHIEFLVSVLQYGNSSQKQSCYRQYIKQIKYENVLKLPPNIEKAAKLIIYLAEFKDLAPLLIQPMLQNYFTYMSYESSTTIVNYLLGHQSILINFITGTEFSIDKKAKLLSQLMTLAGTVSVDNKGKLISLLVNQKQGNLFYRLTQYLHDKEVMKSIEDHEDQEGDLELATLKETVFESIMRTLSTISSSHPAEFQQFLIETIKNKASLQHNLCSSIVFGYIHGNINLKSIVLQLLTNIFNPESSYKHHTVVDESGHSYQSKEIYLLLDRKVLTPICKQLFTSKRGFEGEELILEWISKLFFFFPIVFRRVVVDSGIVKKALEESKKQRILLLLILKILKAMLQIKDAYTIRYLRSSRVIDVLQCAYSRNRGKVNLINSLFKGIQSDIEELNYEGKSQRELERIFQMEEKVVEGV